MIRPAPKDDRKLSYEKPALRTIELSAEEVLAVGCKMAGKSAVQQSSCGIYVAPPCAQRGS